jgi:conjugative transposon TraK protein
MDLRKIKNIPSSFELAKRSLLVVGIFCAITVASAFGWAYYTTSKLQSRIFVLSKDGGAIMAKGLDTSDLLDYRRPEIKSHVRTFHNLFWTYDQYNYNQRLDKSFQLIGNSGKQLYLRLKAEGHYTKLVNQNLEQKLTIDSVLVDDKSYPYRSVVYGSLLLTRGDQDTRANNRFVSSCVLYNVGRTEKNPHGLLIKNYNPIVK